MRYEDETLAALRETRLANELENRQECTRDRRLDLIESALLVVPLDSSCRRAVASLVLNALDSELREVV